MDHLERREKFVQCGFNLSPKELEVIEILKEGKTDKEIAEVLIISPCTVNYHLRSIFQKLEVHSRSQAIVKILLEGIYSGSY